MNADPRLGHEGRAASETVSRRAPEPKSAKIKQGISPLELLLSLEGEVRAVPTYDALGNFMCNETRKLVRCGQIMFFAPGYKKGQWHLQAASSVSSIDRNAPAVRAIEKEVGSFDALEQPQAFKLKKSTLAAGLQLTDGLLLALAAADGRQLGALLFLRNEEFEPSEEVLLSRVASAYGHALSFFSKAKRKAKFARRVKLGIAGSALLAGLAMFVPVPMSVLAPVEIVARDPLIVTAPMNGVISNIGVEANNSVQAGQLLVQFNDTDLLGRLEVTQRNLEVAVARNRRVRQGASLSAEMRREMAVTQSELAVAQAERDEAQAAFDRTKIYAPSNGVAIFASKDDWLGRPVTTGERVMEIGDPQKLEFRVDVAVGDSVVLGEGAAVRVFLHNDPLNVIDATFVDAGFRAEETLDNRLAYRVKAQLKDDADITGLRFGLRGTARISNGTVHLGYYLFRRPISSFRQWTGI